jgi:hypothetical protein
MVDCLPIEIIEKICDEMNLSDILELLNTNEKMNKFCTSTYIHAFEFKYGKWKIKDVYYKYQKAYLFKFIDLSFHYFFVYEDHLKRFFNKKCLSFYLNCKVLL